MRVKVHRFDVYTDPTAVYIRVWQNLIPKMTDAEKQNMCTYLNNLQSEEAEEAISFIKEGAFKQAKEVVAEIADVIARYREELGCYPVYTAPKVPAGIA